MTDNLRFDPSRLSKTAADEYSSSSGDDDDDDQDDFRIPSRNPHADADADAGEFADHHHRKRRRTGRDAKESAALGIFGSESEDDGGPRWKRKNLRTKGVSFVSSAAAAKLSSDSDDEEEDSDGKEDDKGKQPTMRAMVDEEDEEEDEEEEPTRGVGLGFGGGAAAAAAQGLGWAPSMVQRPASTTDSTHTNKPFVRSSGAATNPLGQGFLPSSARVPTLLVQDDEPTTPRTALPSAFSKTKGGKTKINAGSFGARMMAKMGYVEGKGLGKEEQGRNLIIEANLRPQKAGLGAVKEKTAQERAEEKRQARLRGEVVVDSDEEDKRRRAARKKKALGGVGSTPASGTSTPKRAKPKYVTMDEIKKAAPGLTIPDAFTPILDMTGPGKRMLTSSSGLMTPTSASAPESTETAESRKLVKRAQNDLMAILEEWQSLQERKAFLDLQLQQEQQEMDELTASLQGNLSVTTACEAIIEPVESGEMDEKADLSWKLGRIISGLKDASGALSDAMLPQIKDELATLAVAAIYPTLKDYLRLWDPLKDPKPAFVEGLESIRGLLGLDKVAKKSRRKATATPWETVMFKFWLPVVASAVRLWDVREPDQMIAVFEAWDKLMPGFVRTQLLEQDIVRRLEEAVQNWQPRKKSTHNLPHSWIFPWLQYLPSTHRDPKSSTGLVADVKRKFRQLIEAWDFKQGVIPGLTKWKEVLRPRDGRDHWAPLVKDYLLPSMARYTRKNFKVVPQDQEPFMDVLEGVLKWIDVIGRRMVGEVMVAEVFPQWHDVLFKWLRMDDVNYEEISQWFEWWQDSVFPDDIKDLPSIAAEFEKGTTMIERALDLGDRAKTDLKAPEKGPALEPSKPSSRDKARKPRAEPAVSAPPPKPVEEVTFRHVMEDWCQENDLQFVPERKRVHAEGPLYRITARGDGKGGVLVYFKGDTAFVERRNDKPLGIRRERTGDWELLLNMAQ
ncbi:GC-rich sequence DNA-binding factor-like protein-domain-containing protein [Podospora conica]|nr:GC-rich sequence DNA-binding factor-like protein-domain-containing protein [Schizothecium conicum]